MLCMEASCTCPPVLLLCGHVQVAFRCGLGHRDPLALVLLPGASGLRLEWKCRGLELWAVRRALVCARLTGHIPRVWVGPMLCVRASSAGQLAHLRQVATLRWLPCAAWVTGTRSSSCAAASLVLVTSASPAWMLPGCPVSDPWVCSCSVRAPHRAFPAAAISNAP
jgi:hypothetical protein